MSQKYASRDKTTTWVRHCKRQSFRKEIKWSKIKAEFKLLIWLTLLSTSNRSVLFQCILHQNEIPSRHHTQKPASWFHSSIISSKVFALSECLSSVNNQRWPLPNVDWRTDRLLFCYLILQCRVETYQTILWLEPNLHQIFLQQNCVASLLISISI